MNKLFLGDCLEMMNSIPDKSIDCVLADPPYGITNCKWDQIIPLDLMWERLKRIVKSDGVTIIMGNQPFTSLLGASNIGNLKYSLIWQKSTPTGHLNAKKMPMKVHEDILVFYRSKSTYNPQGLRSFNQIAMKGSDSLCYNRAGRRYFQKETNYPRSIQIFHKDKDKIHPTQKPVSLMKYLVKTYTNEGDTILDFVMGSGTAGIACQKLNRNFIGIEKNKEYFEIAKERIEGTKKEELKYENQTSFC